MVITEYQLYYYVLTINILALFLFNILVFQNTYVIFVVIVQNKAKQNEISGFIEIEMAKIGDNWFMKHVSYLL